ncbi:MAG: pyridoxal phosphate-dependent aminotransferase [Acidobacteria bacterium]|nr:pyridoxal phosphate-dependent aminotransferase [Acidobacteriota bacterium]
MSLPVSGRLDLLRPTAVNSILAEVKSLHEPVVSLMRGEPDLKTPLHIVEAAQKALAGGRTGYPDNRGEIRLREAVAGKLARQNGLRYDPGTEVLVTPGATFGIHAALMALLNPGDEVLVPDPVYDAYLSPIRLAGGQPVPVPSSIVAGRFVLPLDALEAAVSQRTKALLLNTPWNPTGTVFSKTELAAIADFCCRHGIALISDEIYEAIVYDGFEHVSPAALSDEVRQRTILINALSKTYAMTGWRAGYVAAPAPLIQAMFLVLQQSSRGPATFVQDAAAVALDGPRPGIEEYSRRRDLVLRELGPYGAMAPEGGFFAMVDVRRSGIPSDEIRRRLLHEQRVVVIHGAAYGPGGEGTLRVSFAAGGDALQEGLRRVRAGLATL